MKRHYQTFESINTAIDDINSTVDDLAKDCMVNKIEIENLKSCLESLRHECAANHDAINKIEILHSNAADQKRKDADETLRIFGFTVSVWKVVAVLAALICSVFSNYLHVQI